ncbi:MAG: hypothetical protein ACLUJR_06400 [Mediterraneibacter gnavus]
MLAYNALMEKLGREHETYLNVPYELEKSHVGDIDEMLYPFGFELEEEYVYDKEFSFDYVNEVKDNMDAWIQTNNPQKDGSMLMYRDSFGESLLPFVADEIGQGYFSRLVPYNLTQIEELHPQYVVIEKVERNIQDFAKKDSNHGRGVNRESDGAGGEDKIIHRGEKRGFLSFGGRKD